MIVGPPSRSMIGETGRTCPSAFVGWTGTEST